MFNELNLSRADEKNGVGFFIYRSKKYYIDPSTKHELIYKSKSTTLSYEVK